MKILMLTPYLPFPPSSGGQIRSFNLIKYLSHKHTITLYSLIKDESERKYVKELEKYCSKVKVFKRSKSPWTIRNILLTGFGKSPFLVIRNLVPEEKEAVKAELESGNYDLIHAETFYVMPHIPKTETPVLLVDQTIEYLVYKHYVENQAPMIARPLYSIDVAKLKRAEKTYWLKADKVVAVSASDKAKMLKLAPKLDVGIVPNGVNLDFFKVRTEFGSQDAPVVLFIANFKWLQNTEAAKVLVNEVFPQVVKKIAKAKLWIVGQHVPDALRSIKRKGVLVNDLAENDEKGIQDAYYNASVFVSPLKGPGGTRLKHLAAMASKLPLITTKVGAEGLGAINNKHILIRNSSDGLAKATLEVLGNTSKAKNLAENARKLVVEKYSWEKMADMLDGIYTSTAQRRQA